MSEYGLQMISEARLTEALARTPADLHVIWTGHAATARDGSMRSRALALIEEVATPVPLRVLLRRAARIRGEFGFDPDAIRSAVRTCQSARPAVYLLVRRQACGDYLAVTDVPWPAGCMGRISGGEVVLGRGVRLFSLPGEVSDQEPPAPRRAASR